jgi:hypothetical protein
MPKKTKGKGKLPPARAAPAAPAAKTETTVMHQKILLKPISGAGAPREPAEFARRLWEVTEVVYAATELQRALMALHQAAHDVCGAPERLVMRLGMMMVWAMTFAHDCARVDAKTFINIPSPPAGRRPGALDADWAYDEATKTWTYAPWVWNPITKKRVRVPSGKTTTVQPPGDGLTWDQGAAPLALAFVRADEAIIALAEAIRGAGQPGAAIHHMHDEWRAEFPEFKTTQPPDSLSFEYAWRWEAPFAVAPPAADAAAKAGVADAREFAPEAFDAGVATETAKQRGQANRMIQWAGLGGPGQKFGLAVLRRFRDMPVVG